MSLTKWMASGALMALAAGLLTAQSLPADLQAKVEARAKSLQSWSTDPQIVAAVKAYNASPSAEAKSMTNEKWTSLTLLDPTVRALAKSPLAEALRARKDDAVSECFVSGADGGKVAFLSKTTSWNHKGKPKHDVPMTGKAWFGPIEVDQSSGAQQVQVGLPVLDGGQPIGSIVVGLSVAKLK